MPSIDLVKARAWLISQQEPSLQFRVDLNGDPYPNSSTQALSVSGTVAQVNQLSGTRSTAPWIRLDSRMGVVTGQIGGVSNPSSYFVAGFVRADADYYQSGTPVEPDGSFSFVPTTGSVDVVKLLLNDVPVAWSNGAVAGDQVVDDYEVRIFVRTDVDYLQDTVPLWASGRFSASKAIINYSSAAQYPPTVLARLTRKSTGRSLSSSEYSQNAGYPGLVRSFYIPQDDPAFGYEGGPDQRTGYRLEQRAWIYDQALAIMAFTALGEIARAKQVIERVRELQNSFPSDVAPLLANETPEIDLTGALAFGYDVYLGQLFDAYVRTGALAWVGMAICYYEQRTGDPQYRPMAVAMAEFMMQLQDGTGSLRGGYGAYNMADYSFQNVLITWHSTEHNVDAYFFFRDLARLTKNDDYRYMAATIAQSLLDNHWNAAEHRFNQGTGDPAHALDVGTWGGMFLDAIGEKQKAEDSLAYAESSKFLVTDSVSRQADPEDYNMTYGPAGPFTGFRPYAPNPSTGDYLDAPTLVWSEGTFGAILLRQRLGLSAEYDDDMMALQAVDPAGGMLYGTSGAESLPYEFHVWPSLAGTGWGIIINADPDALFSPKGAKIYVKKADGTWLLVGNADHPLRVKMPNKSWRPYDNDGVNHLRIKDDYGFWISVSAI